jgi:transcriptional regulator with GAF, ATPase, and Fis domain
MDKAKLVADQQNSLYQRTNAEVAFELENGDKLSLDFLDEREKQEFVMKSFKLFIKYFSSTQKVPLKELMNILERAILIRALSQLNGNQKNAAKFLGLKYTTLHEKIKKHNIRFRKEPIED